MLRALAITRNEIYLNALRQRHPASPMALEILKTEVLEAAQVCSTLAELDTVLHLLELTCSDPARRAPCQHSHARPARGPQPQPARRLPGITCRRGCALRTGSDASFANLTNAPNA